MPAPPSTGLVHQSAPVRLSDPSDNNRHVQGRSLRPNEVGGLADATLRPIWRVTRLFPSHVIDAVLRAAQASG